ncbi:centrosomal of 97 kDa [Brachionus plicatilis]|uniref:Centrosomal of 97 kDa n=1 Tax=Brachionus plicatilis TaxID=10195 RepID=A0A3M7S7Y6_BRAPC|nr:centrosomal of 97 kDa [Brachionus plicatilis]
MKVDLSNKNLKRIDYLFLKQYLKSIVLNNQEEILIENEEDESIEGFVQTICLDNNFLNKLENLESFHNLKNLSLGNNRLVEIKSICQLVKLEYVNLLNNSLIDLQPFKQLRNLIWLNISGNQIKNLDALKYNIYLEYLDASENSISCLSDIRVLTKLHTLNLSGNDIQSLKDFSNFLPVSIKNLHLSYNSIDDLNEVSYLHPQKAEWLHTQGKGRYFKPGQNTQLIEYLIQSCSLSIESLQITKTEADTVIASRDTVKDSSEAHTSDLISDYHNIMVNNYYSSSDSINKDLKLFNQLKNSSYINSKTDPDTDSDRERKSRYLEYDNRPIKPLDTNAFYKQISEFSEVSGEELEEMRKKVVRNRAKTSDNQKLPQQKNFLKAQSRQYSLNKPVKVTENRTTRLRKRSKTQEDLSFSKKTPTKINAVKKTPSSKSTSNTPLKIKNSYSPAKFSISRPESKNSFTIMPSTLEKRLENFSKTEKINEPDANSENNFDKKEDMSILSMEIHSKIQKQRQEMRAQREKNLREFKSQLRLMDQEKEYAEFESIYNIKVPLPVSDTFEDQCATKIQAAFRGYRLRKSKFIRPKILYIKYKKINREALFVKNGLHDLKKAQLELVEFSQNSTQIINELVKKIGSFDFTSQIDKVEADLAKKLKIENEGLMLKVKLLEEKCKSLEEQVPKSETEDEVEFKYKKVEEESVEPKIQIHPPLKVRLQKLNEKSVALKWNHNPKNLFVEITGYKIYINDELCGTMKSSDTIAAINGIQEEGEYKIFLKTFLNKMESDKSNCVITRVKKKHNKNQTSSSVSDEAEAENVAKSANLSNISGISDRDESMEKKLSCMDLPFQNWLDSSRSFLIDESKNDRLRTKPPVSPNQTQAKTKKFIGVKSENDLSLKYSLNEPMQSNSFSLPKESLVRKSISFDEEFELDDNLNEQTEREKFSQLI